VPVSAQRGPPDPSHWKHLQIIPGVSRDSVVGTTIRYGLDGPEIESRWGRGFPHLSRPALESTPPFVQWVLVSFPGVKRPRSAGDHPPPYSARLKKE
jgi:hypothetical protein